MRRADDVFFFTLIDFLVQVSFFGLMMYVLAQAADAELVKISTVDATAIQRLKTVTGVSNITELTDDMTALGPIKELKGTADFIAKAGGIENVQKLNKSISDAGGREKVEEGLERLRKIDEGSGKPPCLFEVVNNKRRPRILATLIGDEKTIRFQSNSAELEEPLKLLGRTFESVEELSLSEFRATFFPLTQKKPDCRYSVRFIERTRLVDARDAAGGILYLNIVKQVP